MAPLFFFIYFDPILIVILQSYKKGKTLFISTLISQLITILLVFLLTINPNIGLMGYTYGITIGLLIKFILLLIFSLKITKYKFKIDIFFPYILLSFIYFLINLLFTNVITFIFSTIVFSSLYLLLLKAFHNKK